MYKDLIKELLQKSPLEIDLDVKIEGRVPSIASSEFLTNKEQGDWAESVVFNAVNEYSKDYFAVKYGRSDTIAAGDPGFADFYLAYQGELNSIGKRPDLLIYRRADFPSLAVDTDDDEQISKAVAGIEVRSSAFLANRYSSYMESRQIQSLANCKSIQAEFTSSGLDKLLEKKNPEIYKLIKNANEQTFRDLDFRQPSWSSTEELRQLTSLLKRLKQEITVLHKRDYLSITPKVEDLSLVNRWIQKYNVKHFYLQVFFDKAYVISFKDILALVSDSDNEEKFFSIERDVKNQGKTTVKINVQVGKEVLGRIDMPNHESVMKELDRGRLLFFVRFSGGKGYLDNEVFTREVINA